jgi:hypothetical protein
MVGPRKDEWPVEYSPVNMVSILVDSMRFLNSRLNMCFTSFHLRMLSYYVILPDLLAASDSDAISIPAFEYNHTYVPSLQAALKSVHGWMVRNNVGLSYPLCLVTVVQKKGFVNYLKLLPEGLGGGTRLIAKDK